MKLSFLLPLIICFISCSQNSASEKKEIIHVYSSSRDSIFYFVGEKFEPGNLIKAVINDSVFIAKLIKMISDTNKTILYKPLAGNSGGAGETMVNVMAIFQKNNVQNIIPALVDSAEMRYFNDISFLEYASARPPEVIAVKSPTSVSSTVPAGTAVLFFWLTKEDKLYYKYDSTHDDKNFIQIKPITVKKIQQVISELERKNGITFNENNLLVKGDGSSLYPVFKKLKEALKQKEIFKFRIVTSTE